MSKVERLVQAVAVDAVAVCATTIVTLRGQAKRIKELEEENGILRTEKHADAEAIGALRDDLDRFLSDRPFVIGWNDGFEHGVKEALRTLHEQWRENSAVKEAAILALIEGATND